MFFLICVSSYVLSKDTHVVSSAIPDLWSECIAMISNDARSVLLHHILSLIAYTFRENREFVFVIIVQFMMSANSRIRFALQIVLVCTVHHLIIIIVQNYLRHWTYKMPVRYILWSVWVRLSIFSLIHYTICGAVCFQFTHSPCDDWENIYTLSYYHHQIGSMNYYSLFRVRSWNNGVHCMSFYILTIIVHVAPLERATPW